MKIALCNEVIAAMPFARQCEFAAALGYDGLEVAPFTLADDPMAISGADAARYRRTATEHGITIDGLHWLLVRPTGLSITSPDAALRARARTIIERLIALCAELGGRYLVHGSPAQRAIHPGQSHDDALALATEMWAAAGVAAAAAGVTYCIEPLSRDQTSLVNTIAEAAAIVRQVGNPALRTMLDTSSAGLAEQESLAALIERWFPTGLLAHVQVNDRNRRGPGQGQDRFAPVFAALRHMGYDGVVAIEPFDYVPDGPAAAARAIGYVRGVLEGLDG